MLLFVGKTSVNNKVDKEKKNSNATATSSSTAEKGINTLELNEIYLSYNKLTSFIGIDSLGVSIEVLDVSFNDIDLEYLSCDEGKSFDN